MCLASTSLEWGTALLTSVTTAFLSLVVEIGLFEPNILFHNLLRHLLKAELSSGCGGFPPEGHLRIRYLEDEVGQSPYQVDILLHKKPELG